jgi:hypothetical protein
MRRLLAVVVLLALHADMAIAQTRLSPSQAQSAVIALSAWLESDHGDADELAALLRYGQSVVPSLAAALAAGPSAARRTRLRTALETGYMTRTSVAASREEYVRYYMGNFEAMYRIRAAQALAAIGGPAARDAMRQSLESEKREDVRAALKELLEQVK